MTQATSDRCWTDGNPDIRTRTGPLPARAGSLCGASLGRHVARASKNAKSPGTISSRLAYRRGRPPARHLRRLQHSRPAVGAARALAVMNAKPGHAALRVIAAVGQTCGAP